MKNLKETIAFRITQLCKERNITVYALAISCGIDKSTIYNIFGEKSKSPEVSSIKKICDGLEITLGQFVVRLNLTVLNRRYNSLGITNITKSAHKDASRLFYLFICVSLTQDKSGAMAATACL